jgi:hypothetical protein
MPARDPLADHSAPADYGSVDELLSRFDCCHHDLVERLADISDDELNAPSLYWEEDPVDVRFRLYRFAWHIQSHIMQADKIRIAIGHQENDIDRLVRLVFSALGDAEGALIGAGESQVDFVKDVAGSINRRTQEVLALVQSVPQ